jgi:hypothetical protein
MVGGPLHASLRQAQTDSPFLTVFNKIKQKFGVYLHLNARVVVMVL